MKRYFGIIIIATLFLSPLAFAEYPDYSDVYINDFENILNPEDSAEIRTLLQSMKSNSGIEAVVVTIETYSSYQTGDATFESFATNLFNYWGVGDADANNGIMILFSRSDQMVRIELGAGYRREYNMVMKSIIDDEMIPEFKQYNYSKGLKEGVKSLYSYLMDGTTSSGKESAGNTLLIILLIAGSIASVIGFIAIKRILRFRPRMCPDCGIQMELLDEAKDDQHLANGQQKEEQIQSVDYDVWSCSGCGKKIIKKYGKWFSGYRGCLQCSYKTMRVSRHTVIAPTYSSSGTGRETGACVHCGYHYETTYTIARLQQSTSSGSGSSSSSSSFGGGRSSGGGASGSW